MLLLPRIRMRAPDVDDVGDDDDGDDQRTDAVCVVNRDIRCPRRRPEAAEHEREVRNRQPRTRVAHRRANENLREDGSCQRDHPPRQHRIVNGLTRRPAPAG